MAIYVCSVCGYEYDESAEGVSFNELGMEWQCPVCGVSKDNFEAEE